MKKICLIVIAFLLILISFNCSTPANVQKDDGVKLSDYKTYMWVDTRASENDASGRATAYADISIHNAVNAELKSRGWQEVNNDPDALVSYDVLVERNVETKQEAVYSQPMTRSYYNPYTKRWSTIYYPSQFQGYQAYESPVKEGTVTITIMDAKTDKSIWLGWTTERLSESRITDSEIKRSVRSIFKQFS